MYYELNNSNELKLKKQQIQFHFSINADEILLDIINKKAELANNTVFSFKTTGTLNLHIESDYFKQSFSQNCLIEFGLDDVSGLPKCASLVDYSAENFKHEFNKKQYQIVIDENLELLKPSKNDLYWVNQQFFNHLLKVFQDDYPILEKLSGKQLYSEIAKIIKHQ